MPLGALVECYPLSPRDQARLHQFGKKFLPRIFLGYALIARRIWKGDILIAEKEDLENLDASEFYPRRLNAKEVLRTQRQREFVFPVPGGTATLSGRDYEFREPTQRREQIVRRARVSVENLIAAGADGQQLQQSNQRTSGKKKMKKCWRERRRRGSGAWRRR